jgi:hypothetical protein
MRIGAVLAAGLVVVAVGLALVLLDSEPRQAGSNYIPEAAEALTLAGRNASSCQADQVIPADAAALRLLVGTYERPTPEFRVSVRAEGDAIAAGRLPAGRPEGHVVVPIEPVDETRANVDVCVEARAGRSDRRTVLYGTPNQIRLEWLRQGDESWLELLPTVAHRFGLGKPFVSGAWVLGLAAVLLGLAWVLALRLALRELGR